MNFSSSKALWIIWEKQQRGRNLSKKIVLNYYELISTRKGIKRYSELVFKTILIVFQKMPKVLLVTNPSIILSLLAIFLKPFVGYRLIIDTHNAGLFPLEGNSKFLQWVANFILRKSTFTIITNYKLEKYVINQGGKAIVIPDPLPEMRIEDLNTEFIKPDKFNIALIRGGGKDEPIDLVLEMIKKAPPDAHFIITGKNNNQFSGLTNVTLTGYLEDAKYNNLLKVVDVLMILSTRNDNLNCGAYEGVALEKPMILSDSEVIRWYFSKGVIYVKSSSDAILSGIDEIRRLYTSKQNEIRELKTELEKKWHTFLEPLINELKK